VRKTSQLPSLLFTAFSIAFVSTSESFDGPAKVSLHGFVLAPATFHSKLIINNCRTLQVFYFEFTHQPLKTVVSVQISA